MYGVARYSKVFKKKRAGVHFLVKEAMPNNVRRQHDPRRTTPLLTSTTTCSFSSQAGTESLVTWEVDDETPTIATITLNAPKSYNALTVEMGKEFQQLMHRLDRETFGETQVRAVILRGAGDKAFSAGGDLEWLNSLPKNPVHVNVDVMLHFYQSFLCLRQSIPVPVIAALPGPAMGAGACLALACDFRVVASHQERILGFPFTKLGIPSGMGGLYLLQKCSGMSMCQASELLVCGQSLTGEQAMEKGLANRLVSHDLVQDEARKMALEVAACHPVAVRSMIRSWRLGNDAGLAESLYRDAHAQALCYHRKDWGKGLSAVANKTEPADFDDYHAH